MSYQPKAPGPGPTVLDTIGSIMMAVLFLILLGLLIAVPHPLTTLIGISLSSWSAQP